MSRLPTPVAVEHLFDGLRSLNRRPNTPTLAQRDSKLVDSLQRRMLAALERDRTGTVTPDGYPSVTGGGGSRWNGSSSTERAAVALADGDTGRDWHHELLERATTALNSAVTNLNTLRAALDSLDDLTSDAPPAPRTCQHCTAHLPKSHARVVHRRGTVGDRLTVALDLCEPCYLFVWRSTRPGSQAGLLPDGDQIRHHDETGKWRVRVA